MENITNQMRLELRKALPNEACKQHPTKKHLTTINPSFVIERLNDVFGVGIWQLRNEVIISDIKEGQIVVKVSIDIPKYGVHLEQFGGNDNGGEETSKGERNKGFDLGDAFKGACTDGLTKIASYLEIGLSIFQGKGNQNLTLNLSKTEIEAQEKAKKEAEIETYYNKVEAFCKNEAPKDYVNAYYTAIHNKYISKAPKLKDDKRFNDLVEKHKPEIKEPSNEFEDALNSSKKIVVGG